MQRLESKNTRLRKDLLIYHRYGGKYHYHDNNYPCIPIGAHASAGGFPCCSAKPGLSL